jgi:hypothetical protein
MYAQLLSKLSTGARNARTPPHRGEVLGELRLNLGGLAVGGFGLLELATIV